MTKSAKVILSIASLLTLSGGAYKIISTSSNQPKTLQSLTLAPPGTTDADFCIDRTTSSPITAASGQTYRALHINAGAGKVGITVPAGAHDIHITKCWIENAQNGNGGIFVGAGCYNIYIDTNFITTSYRGVYLNGAGKTGTTAMANLKVNNNRFLNIADAAGHPNGGGSSIQFNNCNGGGMEQNYNKTLTTIVSAEVGDVYNYYKTNGIATSWAQANYNQVQGGSTLPAGKSGVILGDVGGSYQIAYGNTFVNSGAQGAQVQGGHDIILRHNTAYGVATSYTLAGFTYGNYSGVSSYNVTIDSNTSKWFNKSGSRLDKWFDPSTVSQPTGWTTNISDNTLTASILPTPLFSTCSVIVSPPVISYSPNSNTYTIGTAIASKSPINTGGGASSYAITPALSAGLSFNNSTGVISGTPTATNGGTTYTITATNTGGSSSTTIGIVVNSSLSVPAFSYSPSSNIYTVGTVITSKTPINSGGSVVSYSISPSLPAGLSFTTTTGVISGTPTGTSGSTVYTITGTNESGTGSTTVTIQVNAPTISIPIISYTSSSNSYTYGTTIPSLYPQNTGGNVVTWAITPSLPSGLTFVNGLISGTPSVTHSSTSYTITGTNTAGTSTTHVTIVVNKAPLVISADNKQRAQGFANPALTVTYYGFKFSDNAGSLTNQPTVSTTANSGSASGIYPITATGAVSSNYAFSYVNGVMLVGSGTAVSGRFGGIIRLSR